MPAQTGARQPSANLRGRKGEHILPRGRTTLPRARIGAPRSLARAITRQPAAPVRIGHGRLTLSDGILLTGATLRMSDVNRGGDNVAGLAIITEACIDVKDRACVDVCPVQ